MKTSRLFVAVTAFVLFAVGVSNADEQAKQSGASETVRPLQLALVPPSLQLVPEEESIGGFRLNIYGRNQNVSGVDIGLMHETTGNFSGIEFGILNYVHGDFVGLELGCIYSETKGNMSGVQVGMFNHAGSIGGVQIGLVNFADDMTGFQFGLFNQIKSKEKLPVLPLINAKF